MEVLAIRPLKFYGYIPSPKSSICSSPSLVLPGHLEGLEMTWNDRVAESSLSVDVSEKVWLPQIIHFNFHRMFHYIFFLTILFLGTPILGNPHMSLPYLLVNPPNCLCGWCPPPVQKSARDPWARGHRNDHLEIEMETFGRWWDETAGAPEVLAQNTTSRSTSHPIPRSY